MTGGSAHQKRGSARTLCPLADAATPFAGGAPGAESVESAAFLILPGVRYPVPPTRAYPEHRSAFFAGRSGRAERRCVLGRDALQADFSECIDEGVDSLTMPDDGAIRERHFHAFRHVLNTLCGFMECNFCWLCRSQFFS